MMSDEMLLENNLQPHRRAVLEYEFGEPSSFSYLIGNTKPVYIGITSYTVSPVRYLFLGSGDLLCCGRQCLRWYKTKTGNHHSPTDIRTYGDILFLYEGIFDYCNRPGLAVSYLDMNDIEETNVADMTRLVRTLSMIELHRQAENISGARQNSILRHSDYNAFDIKASAEEFDLMRKFFKQNSRQTQDARQHDLIEP
ncbi:unnamed protein product [Rotaria socialis]|uniref:Uncharacterized protein n=1 Tax=Rotaria socialis TaxID=392032 RepID=A0A817S8E2_9BILA|nr:unnamed protein product [Rotaria socialis]